ETLGFFADPHGRELIDKLAKGEWAGPNGAETKGQLVRSTAVNGRGAADGELVHESKGYIIPVHQIQVSPKVSGMVMDLRIEEGMQVKEGDILAELEITEYKAEFDRVQGMVNTAKARWQELWKYR